MTNDSMAHLFPDLWEQTAYSDKLKLAYTLSSPPKAPVSLAPEFYGLSPLPEVHPTVVTSSTSRFLI